MRLAALDWGYNSGVSSSNIKLDHDLLREILDADHSYYGSRRVEFRSDSRLSTGAGDLIASQLGPEMRVLDIGCAAVRHCNSRETDAVWAASRLRGKSPYC